MRNSLHKTSGSRILDVAILTKRTLILMHLIGKIKVNRKSKKGEARPKKFQNTQASGKK